METILTWLAVTLAGLLVSARAHVTVTAPVRAQVPVLGLAALAVILALAVSVLYIMRILVRDGLRLRPGMAET